MTDTAELRKRLTRKVEDTPYAGISRLVNPDGPEAADALTAKDAEIAALKEKVKRQAEAEAAAWEAGTWDALGLVGFEDWQHKLRNPYRRAAQEASE